MTAAVFDASALVQALIASQQIPETARLLRRFSDELWLPQLARQEFVNAVWRLERRGVISRVGANVALGHFARLSARYVDSPAWIDKTLATARLFGQPRIYDAIYLICAEELDADLWTADRRFVASFGSARPARVRLLPDDVD
ncbi:MAG: type II toxin-antitoxin system VapC family toxin [Tepidiformaceae bacterium]